jgi:glycine/D-amino acid oxidase-like deaminating enzyme
VVGAGISGALIADELAAHGHEVLVLDERDVGWGSTAASTALIQYEIDTHLVDLARRYGESAAVLAYQACAAAVRRLGEIARPFRDVGFASADSLYYASVPRHRRVLQEEYALRRRHGFDVAWLERGEVAERYGLDSAAALLNRPAARLDPYRLTYRLLMRLQRRGVRVHDRSRVTQLVPGARGVVLSTPGGARVEARHVVLAAGYASQRWLRARVAKDRSSYAFVTDPLPAAELGALRNTLMWESRRPYLYLRTTADDRLIVGGEDDRIDVPARRDRRVGAKAQRLLHKARQLLPRLALEPVFCWGGTFAETADGLPYFGTHPQWGPRVLFAMAFGGNGITYSTIGAALLRARLERRQHPLAELFSFARH